MRTVITGEAVELELPAASLFTRGGALVIDVILYALTYVAFIFLFGLTSGAAAVSFDEALLQATVLAGAVLCFVVLPIGIETLSRGRTVGRLIFGVRVVRDDGGSLRLRHSVIRVLIAVFEVYMTSGLVAVVCALINDKGKRLGDMVAGTYGIQVRQPKIRPMMLPVPQHLQSWTQIADLGRVPDELALRISRLLRSAENDRAGNPMIMEQHAAGLAQQLRPYVSPPPPPSSAMDLLTAVMAERRNREYRRLRRQQERQEALERRLHTVPY